MQILQLSISVFFIGLLLFLIPVLVRLFKILGIVQKIAVILQDVSESVQSYLLMPARLFLAIRGGLTPIIEKIISFFTKK